jgi:hypothetical protein
MGGCCLEGCHTFAPDTEPEGGSKEEKTGGRRSGRPRLEKEPKRRKKMCDNSNNNNNEEVSSVVVHESKYQNVQTQKKESVDAKILHGAESFLRS